jgi:hypothetical protein
MNSQLYAPAALPSPPWTEGYMCPGQGRKFVEKRKILLLQGFEAWPSSLESVSILTALCRLTVHLFLYSKPDKIFSDLWIHHTELKLYLWSVLILLFCLHLRPARSFCHSCFQMSNSVFLSSWADYNHRPFLFVFKAVTRYSHVTSCSYQRNFPNTMSPNPSLRAASPSYEQSTWLALGLLDLSPQCSSGRDYGVERYNPQHCSMHSHLRQ